LDPWLVRPPDAPDDERDDPVAAAAADGAVPVVPLVVSGAAPGEPPARWARTALAVSTMAFSLAILGTTAITVALPEIGRDLGGGVTGLQWVANAYTLMLASLLLSMGALCDQRGARRVMLAGLVLFGLGAAVATAAPSLGVLIAGQLTLGAGAAALVPASLALLTHAYPDGAQRAHAVGVYSAASAAVLAVGPVLGGAAIEAASWRIVFALDIPCAVLLGVLLWRRVDETPHARARDLDLPGQALAVGALGALTFGLISSGGSGWTAPETLLPIALALGLGAAFVAVEHVRASPMLPLSLFGVRTFNAVSGAGLLVNFAIYGQMFVLSLYLQNIRGLSPFETGATFIALTLGAAVSASQAGRITARHGARPPAVSGGAVAAVATLMLLTVGETTPLVVVIVALVGMGVGGGLLVPALTSAIVMEAPRAQVGVAAAVFTASRQAGGLLGVAVLGAMITGTDFVAGMHASLIVTAGALAACTLTALLIPKRHHAAMATA
jgi:MFS transporter, DHA2 family, methylenomycin A resistance protein